MTILKTCLDLSKTTTTTGMAVGLKFWGGSKYQCGGHNLPSMVLVSKMIKLTEIGGFYSGSGCCGYWRWS